MSLAKSENQSRSISPTKFWLYLGILAIMVFFLAPILWQILTSVKLNKDISAIPNVYLPREFTLEHYAQLFSRRPFLTYVFNSALVASISTVLCLVLGSPAAYALTRMNLPGEKLILTGILVITLFPYVLLFLGLLEIVKAVGLGNNYLSPNYSLYRNQSASDNFGNEEFFPAATSRSRRCCQDRRLQNLGNAS